LNNCVSVVGDYIKNDKIRCSSVMGNCMDFLNAARTINNNVYDVTKHTLVAA